MYAGDVLKLVSKLSWRAVTAANTLVMDWGGRQIWERDLPELMTDMGVL